MISFDDYKKAISEVGLQTKIKCPNSYLGYTGIEPIYDQGFKYNPSPINTQVFARTGGNGVHFSLLEISSTIQIVVITIPTAFADSIKRYNVIIAENLYEFLSLGYFNGWYQLEDLSYNPERTIKFYEAENKNEDYLLQKSDLIFVNFLRNHLKYNHCILSENRLKELEGKYFCKLKFNKEFMTKFCTDQ